MNLAVRDFCAAAIMMTSAPSSGRRSLALIAAIFAVGLLTTITYHNTGVQTCTELTKILAYIPLFPHCLSIYQFSRFSLLCAEIDFLFCYLLFVLFLPNISVVNSNQKLIETYDR